MNKTLDLDFLKEQVEESYKLYKKRCTFAYFTEYNLNAAIGKFTMAAELGVITVQRADEMIHELVRIFDSFHPGNSPE